MNHEAMRVMSRVGACLGLIGAATGCEPAPAQTAPDAAADLGADSPAADVTAEASAVRDVAAEARDDADAGPRCPALPEQPAEQTGGLCDDANVTDITDAVAAGGRYLGWVNAPRRPASQIQWCGTRGGDFPQRERMFRYRMRTSSHLRVSTDNLGSHCGPEGVKNTFVGVYRRCALPFETGDYLGCNSDAAFDLAGPSTTLTTEAIPAGTIVFIAVGSVARGSSIPPVAPFELSVDEVPAPRVGDACLVQASESACPSGSTCVARSAREAVGRCVLNGTAPNTECRPRGSTTDGGVSDAGDASADVADGDVDERCDPGLACAPFTFVNGVCLIRRDYGESCDAFNNACRRSPVFNCQTSPRDPTSGTCVMDGSAIGATCGIGAEPACPRGSTCTSRSALAWCAAASAVGETCDPDARRSLCATGNSCVRAGAGDTWLCRPDGTAPGSACRASAPRCEPGLSCSSDTGRGRCAATLDPTVTACDPRWGAQRCGGDRACMATSYDAGRCVDVTREVEGDNGHPTLAQPVTLPAMIRGGLRFGSDLDCYAFDLPAGARLRAETSNGAGWCAADEDTVITVRRMNNEVIEINDDAPMSHLALVNTCSQVDAAWTNSPMRDLAAGRYAVCVGAFRGESPIGEYFLAITAERP